MKNAAGVIARVEEGSPADDAGLKPGDIVLSVGGRPVQDILQFTYLTADDPVDIEILRDGERHTVRLEREDFEDLGIDFTEELFDGLKKCGNRCIFCFLAQMPRGMRNSLYQKDDDYRLSFAHGNYITLTNLTEEDMERITGERMSPLYVSVHATEPELRARMMGTKKAGSVMDQLRRFADARLTVHCQIVLVPGVNDGEHLERTVRDLASLYPSVADIAVVPVGLTRHRENLAPLKPFDAGGAEVVLKTCRKWRREFLKEFGTRLIFPSDEFYLLAGEPFPSRESYEGFPQLADGVGVSRLFLDELARLRRRIGRLSVAPGRYVLVTGALSAPLVRQLAELLSLLPGVVAETCVIQNRFFGETVTVTGLLTGADIADALKSKPADCMAVLPNVVLCEGKFLDDMTPEDVSGRVQCRVMVVPSSPAGMLRCLRDAARQAGLKE